MNFEQAEKVSGIIDVIKSELNNIEWYKKAKEFDEILILPNNDKAKKLIEFHSNDVKTLTPYCLKGDNRYLILDMLIQLSTDKINHLKNELNSL